MDGTGDRSAVIPERCAASKPESRDSGSGPSDHPGMTKTNKKREARMSDVYAEKALVFDVFGTVVDWRTSLINDFIKWSETSGIKADWTALVDGWRAVYSASMDEVRKHPERGYQ